MVPRETGNNAYANVWKETKNIIVFLIVANTLQWLLIRQRPRVNLVEGFNSVLKGRRLGGIMDSKQASAKVSCGSIIH